MRPQDITAPLTVEWLAVGVGRLSEAPSFFYFIHNAAATFPALNSMWHTIDTPIRPVLAYAIPIASPSTNSGSVACQGTAPPTVCIAANPAAVSTTPTQGCCVTRITAVWISIRYMTSSTTGANTTADTMIAIPQGSSRNFMIAFRELCAMGSGAS